MILTSVRLKSKKVSEKHSDQYFSYFLNNLELKMCEKHFHFFGKAQKRVELNTHRIFNKHYFFLKIGRNDLEYFNKQYIYL